MTVCRFRRFLLLMLATALIAGTAIAQQHGAAQPQPHQAQPAQHEGPPAHGQGAQGSQEPYPFDQQLARQSREAAGEEEGHKEFKESPSVKWVGRMFGLSPTASYWALLTLNFLIIAGLIYAFTKSSIPAMFRARTESIQKGMEEARRASEEANRRLGEIETRLSRLDVEIAEMRAAADTEALKEEERIRAAAEEDKQKIVKNAEAEIAAAAKLARRDLRAYAAELAVGLAETRIHIDAATDQALVRSFVDQLGKDGQ
jgi:F-type H+-transporting ATPase subunit b